MSHKAGEHLDHEDLGQNNPSRRDWRARVGAVLGPDGVIDTPAGMAPYLREWRGNYTGRALLVARPSSTGQVARLVAMCGDENISIVPQGGNTGLVGGAVATGGQDQIIVSLERMCAIRRVDARDNTMTVEAGCTLSAVHQAAAANERLFPLRMAAQERCQIGGAIATNAGGSAVLHYGSMRHLVLGIEAVLADGRVFHGLKRLRKDNAGYDLKQLFIGSEGTLGLITAAVIRLFPIPAHRTTVMGAFATPTAVIDFFHALTTANIGNLTAFEMMPRLGLDFVLRHETGTRDPFASAHPWYAVIEVSGHSPGTGMRATIDEALSTGVMADAVVAKNAAQGEDMWRLRTALPGAQTCEGGSIKHDISVPVSAIADFLDQALLAVRTIPGVRPLAFGHVGDGNIHFNLSQPVAMDRAQFLEKRAKINRLVHDIAHAHGGSISAEHGIGLLRQEELRRLGDPVSLDLMHQVKQALDPRGLMNPGKIL